MTSQPTPRLTRGQLLVIAGLARGHDTLRIASDLHTSPAAVRTLIRRAAARTGLKRRPQPQLVDFAYQHGYLTALPTERRPRPTYLTPRLMEVLEGTARGLSLNEIAAELHISRATAHEHRRRLRKLLGAHTRAHAVAIAWQAGLLGPATAAPAKTVRPLKEF
ncbi:helix-turn-helix transcriptional regulator [Streptomyces sp. NRRL B-1347]|uniref:helix-turn-helix transcriptional regulator n=1 Tax=Streptomyces sp. NRRL B-1347 TaxID=1476877 RepID=UPI00068B2E66|nr:helix-turn-helix transcriptional regulator [Streptomyces sp. NRRL B-1347]